MINKSKKIVSLLRKKKLKISFAESCTGGLLSSAVASISGSSKVLLKKVIELIKSKNFSINNIDINVIAQKPKIKKYSKKMIQTISKICEINPNQINIKGRTTEKLGLIGKGKAIASEVIASVVNYD